MSSAFEYLSENSGVLQWRALRAAHYGKG